MAYQLGSVWGTSNPLPGPTISYTPGYYSMQDKLSAGAGAGQAGVAAAQQGVGAVQSTGQKMLNDVNSAVGKSNTLAEQAARVVNGTDRDVEAMRALGGGVGKQVDALKGNAARLTNYGDELRGKADTIGAYAPQIGETAAQLMARIGLTDALGGKIQDSAAAHAPLISQLGDMGGTLFGQGQGMVNDATAANAIAMSLLGMDGSTPLSAEFLKAYRSVDPETLAAMGAADAQSASDNALAQQMRAVSRAGGSVTGGNSLALQRQYKTALATALAAAKQKGRLAGIQMQEGILKDITSAGQSLLGSATQMFTAGTGAESAGAGAVKSAGDLQSQMAADYAKAADIFGLGNTALGNAGDLLAKAANVESTAADAISKAANAESAAASANNNALAGLGAQAGIFKDAANLGLSQANALNDTAKTLQSGASVQSGATNSYLGNLNSAYSTLSNANANLANYYRGAAATEVRAGGGGARGGGGGFTSTDSPKDDWMDWKGTGHSQTWNKNNLPKDVYNELLLK